MAIKSATASSGRVQLLTAKMWHYSYVVLYQLGRWWLRYRSMAIPLLLLLLVFLSLCLAPTLQSVLAAHYPTEQEVAGLRSLILNIGSALIGAAAIVTSLVLFAMQVNIERMPHGLFRRLSTDSKLLSSFAAAFLLAISVATLSTLVERHRLAHVVLSAFWAIVFILMLFMYAYKRALLLINPLQQLGILIHDTRRELLAWARRAKRASPLLQPDESVIATQSPTDPSHDLPRTWYFQINHQWAEGSKRAVRHAMSFARRYAEQGDHEVSHAALNAVVVINAAYIEAKGRTFYASNPFIGNQLTSDGIINDTLECLRQSAQDGIARRDEQQIEQTLQAMAALVQVYLVIDYSSPYTSKTHAQLAAGYLASAVQAVVPHKMADVLMEGQRLMGQSAQHILANGNVNDIAVLSEKVALIACAGCAIEDYRPVTMEGMEQFAKLTVDLLRTRSHDIHFAVKEVRQDVSMVAKLFIHVAEPPLSNIHSTYLGPYYSSTSPQSLRGGISILVNALAEAQANNEDAKSVIRNIEQWADGLYQTDKELLLLAIKLRSQFTFDIILWITGITEILLAVSNVQACDEYTQEKLRKHASWLIATLSFIPDDKDTVAFVENFQMTETLFSAVVDAHNRSCHDIAMEIGKILLSWTFKGGKHRTGRPILELGLCGLAAFALKDGEDGVAWFRTAVIAQLAKDSSPGQEMRDDAARKILERAANPDNHRLMFSSINMAIAKSDSAKLLPLLEEIAGLLSPANLVAGS